MAAIARDRAHSAEDVYVEGRSDGWLTFAAVMLGIAGTLNVIDGVVALARSKFFIGDAVYVFSDLRTWGWIVLVLGSLELLAAASLSSRSQSARWFGVAVASLNGIAQLMFVQAYPFWSLALFAADVAVVYGLSMYGGRRARSA